jgi:hypothetical protein
LVAFSASQPDVLWRGFKVRLDAIFPDAEFVCPLLGNRSSGPWMQMKAQEDATL